MKVVFYSSENNGAGSHVQSLITSRVPDEGIEIYRTVDALSKRFRFRTRDIEAAVLVASSTHDLETLADIRHLLSDTRVILILPDSTKKNVSTGHLLYPRFIEYADGNFKGIAAVFNKMFGLPRSGEG